MVLEEDHEIEQNVAATEIPMAKQTSSTPLNGLRGLMSFHIMIHHFFFYSPLNLNLMGAVSKKDILDFSNKFMENYLISFSLRKRLSFLFSLFCPDLV